MIRTFTIVVMVVIVERIAMSRIVNFTIELETDQEVLDFEVWLERYVKIKDVTIIPDTKKLYETDSHFKKLTSEYYKAKKIRNDYINNHNFK